MPTIDFTKQELEQLVYVIANAHGPGINWILTNGLLTRLQAQGTADVHDGRQSVGRTNSGSAVDRESGLGH